MIVISVISKDDIFVQIWKLHLEGKCNSDKEFNENQINSINVDFKHLPWL